jgi:hypothetical protein
VQVLYTTTLLVRSVIGVVLATLFVYSHDPLFISLFLVVGLGMVLTRQLPERPPAGPRGAAADRLGNPRPAGSYERLPSDEFRTLRPFPTRAMIEVASGSNGASQTDRWSFVFLSPL